MLRTGVEAALRRERESDGFLFPDYDGYCIGNIPDTVRSVLDTDGRRPLPDDVFGGVDTDVNSVVLVLIDGLGLHSWRRGRERHPFLDRISDAGTVTPLTSVYPSTTAAAITTLQTGKLPCEHGRVGWTTYDPNLDRAYRTLSGEVKSGGESGVRVEGADTDAEYHYRDLTRRGVDCHRLQPFEVTTPGVTHQTYDGLDAFGDRLGGAVADARSPSYVYAYTPHVDQVSHAHGTRGDAFQQTLGAVCAELTAFVDGLDEGVAEETLLLVTADHGQVTTDPDQNVDLSTNETVMENLRCHENGTPIMLSGSPRNVHLHLQEGTVPETRAALSHLDVRAFTRQEALDRSLFGDRPVSDAFRRRCGDLVVTHRDRGLWFGDAEPDVLRLVGMHGGLNPVEMLVPFAAVRADRL